MTSSHSQPTSIPIETIQEIVSWIDPKHKPWQYKNLCRHLYRSLTAPDFARLNLRRTTPLNHYTLNGTNSSPSATEQDSLWFQLPSAYQIVYTQESLAHLTSIAWAHVPRTTGCIPPAIHLISNLTHLTMKYSHLKGRIPLELCTLQNLVSLDLSGNYLTGEIPNEIGRLSQLQTLNLEFNKLSGSIPTGIGQLWGLETCHLSNNKLSGPIPLEFGSLLSLRELSLQFNGLQGVIPRGLGCLVNLEALHLSSNELVGAVPPEILNLKRLRVFSLTGNKLRGLNDDEFRNFADPVALTKVVREGGRRDGTLFSLLFGCSARVREAIQ